MPPPSHTGPVGKVFPPNFGGTPGPLVVGGKAAEQSLNALLSQPKQLGRSDWALLISHCQGNQKICNACGFVFKEISLDQDFVISENMGMTT